MEDWDSRIEELNPLAVDRLPTIKCMDYLSRGARVCWCRQHTRVQNDIQSTWHSKD